jgi:hypothetical protein
VEEVFHVFLNCCRLHFLSQKPLRPEK